MNAHTAQRPIGFRPEQVSALVNSEIVFQHAGEVAFLWTLRGSAIAAPHYSLSDLARLDERVEAHVGGLRVAGELGWQICQANLATGGPGEVFALSALAFGAGERARMRDALFAGCASPEAWSGLVSALGWLDYDRIASWLQILVNAQSPVHRRVAIAACAIHRRDPGPSLAAAVEDSDVLLRARALRAVGELKRHDLTDCVHEHVSDEDEECCFWAAWSLTLLGEREGPPALLRFAYSEDALAIASLQLGLRGLDPADGRRWLSSFATTSDRVRLTIMGTGIIGDPATVPWLINKMATPALARIAGEAFAMITGADLAYHDLDQDAPAEAGGESWESERHEGGPIAYEDDLPWPSSGRVAQWWDQNRNRFVEGRRYLRGQPISAESAVDVLRHGTQRQRGAAALELALLHPTRLLWEIRAPGWRQRQQLRDQH